MFRENWRGRFSDHVLSKPLARAEESVILSEAKELLLVEIYHERSKNPSLRSG
jgi:hypothetical protein